MTLLSELQKSGDYSLAYDLQQICPTPTNQLLTDPQNLPLLNLPIAHSAPLLTSKKLITLKFNIPKFSKIDQIFTINSNLLILINKASENPTLVIFSQNQPFPLPLRTSFINSCQIRNSDMIFHSQDGVLTLSLLNFNQHQIPFNNASYASISNSNDILIFGTTIFSVLQGIKQGFPTPVKSAKPFSGGCLVLLQSQLILMSDTMNYVNLPVIGHGLAVAGEFCAVLSDEIFCVFKEKNGTLELFGQVKFENSVKEFQMDLEGKIWVVEVGGRFGVYAGAEFVCLGEGVDNFCLNGEEVIYSMSGEVFRGFIE